MVAIPTLCRACTRYQGASTCSSFPDDTIPDRIVASGGEHRFSLHGEPPFELGPDQGNRVQRMARLPRFNRLIPPRAPHSSRNTKYLPGSRIG